MQIVEKSLAELTPYQNNPRQNDNAVEYVKNSIKEYGWKVPIVIDTDGVIVCGHTRYKAAEQLGIKSVPCVVADDLTDEQIKAFRLVDNRVGEIATWDLPLLAMELEELPAGDMSAYGFNTLLDDDYTEQTVTEVEEDDYDVEPPTEPKAKRGDIYLLGNHVSCVGIAQTLMKYLY